MLTSLPDFQRYALAIAGRAGLRLVWNKRGSTPCIDGATLYIPTPELDAGEDELTKTKTAITHEVGGHYMHTDFSAPMREKVSTDSKLGMLWNLFEDGRVEDLSGSIYAGDRELFQASDRFFMGELAAGRFNPACYTKVLLGAWTVYALHKSVDNPALSAICDQLLTIGKGVDGYDKMMDKVLKSGILSKYADACLTEDRVRGTKATLEIARMLWEELPEKEKEEDKKKQKGGKGDKADKDGKDKAESEEGGDGDGEGDGKDKGEGEGKGKGEGEGTAEGVVNWEDVLKSEHSPTHHGATAKRIKYDMAESPYGEHFNTTPINEYEVHPIKETGGRCYKYASQIASKAMGFTNRVRTQLQIATRTRWQFGQKKGKLNKGSLYRVTIPDAGSYGERVFKNQTHQNDLDIAIYILLDMSGSMNGSNKIEHGMAACAVLSDAIGNALHIPVEIAGFSEHRVPDIYQVRGFHERNVSQDTILRRIDSYTSSMSENTDGEAVLYAYDRIKGRREKRKLIIVLSDGSPAGGYSRGNIAKFTKRVIQDVEKTPVEIVGIGIMDTNVKKFYKSHTVINDASKLEEALLSVVKSRIIGG